MPEPSSGATPGLVAVRREAAELLTAEVAALDGQQRAWLELLPLEEVAAASFDFPPWSEFWHVAPAISTLGDRLVALGGPAWPARYARMLLLHLIAEGARPRPALKVGGELVGHVEAGLRLLMTVAGSDFDGFMGEEFQKDLGVAQTRILPHGGMAGCAIRVRPAALAAPASVRERIRLAIYLRRQYRQAGLYAESHAWRGFREGRPASWADRNRPLHALVAANPKIAGTLHASWYNDPALERVSPRLWQREQQQSLQGGRKFRMNTRRQTSAMRLNCPRRAAACMRRVNTSPLCMVS